MTPITKFSLYATTINVYNSPFVVITNSFFWFNDLRCLMVSLNENHVIGDYIRFKQVKGGIRQYER
jgi:hypothetical protein